MTEPEKQFSRREILLLAILFEGGLGVLACLVGWFVEVFPWEQVHWDATDAALGVLATLPMLVLLLVFACLHWSPLEEIRRALDRALRAMFRHSTVADLALISLLAGVGEEALFRGLVQEGLGRAYGAWPALVAASLLFGLVHPITPFYVVLTSLAGAYLGWLYLATGNLLVPILAHALYDFVALVYLLRFTRPDEHATSAEPTTPGSGHDSP
ncbi:MAG: CPBP family intramembrane metalloprotease [Gemmataceae bacterium]|nr:CPBP family intramembrane metalloprotease [Gemmataceae bacterium]